MKKYHITRTTNAYSASKSKDYKGHDILRYDGLTPTKWVHDDNMGDGYTLDEALAVLRGYASEDGQELEAGETVYDFDVDRYMVEEMK